MKLLIFCVDGFDPDYAEENGFARFPYQRKLSIPKECYVMTEEGEAPHTSKVWPTRARRPFDEMRDSIPNTTEVES